MQPIFLRGAGLAWLLVLAFALGACGSETSSPSAGGATSPSALAFVAPSGEPSPASAATTAPTLAPTARPAGWLAIASLMDARTLSSQTRVADGTVMVVGGWSGQPSLASSERDHADTGLSWVAGTLRIARAGQTAVTPPPGGDILVAVELMVRAIRSHPQRSSTTSMPSSSDAASMTTPRTSHVAVVLPDGEVLVAGGQHGDGRSLATPTSLTIESPARGTRRAR